MAIVTAAVSASGRDFTNNTSADQLVVANRRIKMFCERTRVLYDDQITFDLSPNGSIPANGVYDLRDTTYTFGKAICWLDTVLIEGVPLRDPEGIPGLTPIGKLPPGYQVQAASRPRCAVQLSPTSVRLFPVPDQSYSNCFATGAILHPEINVAPFADGTQLSIPDEYCEAVAVFVAIGLIQWTAAESSDYERMAFLSRPAADQMQILENKATTLKHRPAVRGGKRGGRSFSIG